MGAVFTLDDLSVRFETTDGVVNAVNGVTLEVSKGECLGIVGESGSGKSQCFMAGMGVLANNGTTRGEATLDGHALLERSGTELNRLRGTRISMVFQDPMTSLTPHLRIGTQLTEQLRFHQRATASQARSAALDMLERVRIPEPRKRLEQYPHELSGGMRQRVMIAMALMCEPEVVIADEPTTGLDVTVQAQIIELFRELKVEFDTAIILITHDMGVVAQICDRVMIMYAGRIVEQGGLHDIFHRSEHPYTLGLLDSMPRLDDALSGPLPSIPGQPPDLLRLPAGCPFAERCPRAFARCETELPLLRPASAGVGDDHFKACHLNDGAPA